jgi:hypothetical protein
MRRSLFDPTRSQFSSDLRVPALVESEENHKKFPCGSDISTTKPKAGLYEQRTGVIAMQFHVWSGVNFLSLSY